MTCSSSEYGSHRCIRCDNEVDDTDAVKDELLAALQRIEVLLFAAVQTGSPTEATRYLAHEARNVTLDAIAKATGGGT